MSGGRENLKPWPPAPPGNSRGMTHGAFSDRRIQPRAAELAPGIFEANVHLDAARDRAAVLRYAVLLARLERAYAWLAEQDDEVFVDAEKGEAHKVFERLEKWERMADAAEDRLAIAPLTRARLGLTEAQTEAQRQDLALEWKGERER